MPSQSRILLNQSANNSAIKSNSNNNLYNNNNRRNSISSLNNNNEINEESNNHFYDVLPLNNSNSSNSIYNNNQLSKSPEEINNNNNNNNNELLNLNYDINDNESNKSINNGRDELSIKTNEPLLSKPIESKKKPTTKPKRKTTQNLPQDWHRTHREPGINPQKVDLPNLKTKVVIQIVDYSSEEAKFNCLINDELEDFLNLPRPEWAKVRWIHTSGLSWDVIKILGIKYDLHPLSLEDMLNHGSSSTRSKADYYRQHLFVSVVVHKTLASSIYEEHSSTTTNPTSSNTNTNSTTPSDHYLREQLGFHSRALDEENLTGINIGDGNGGRNFSSSSTTTSNLDEYFARQQRIESELVFGPKLRKAFEGIERNKEDIRMLSSNSPGLFKTSDQSTSLYHTGSKRTLKNSPVANKWTIAALTKDIKIHINIEQLSIFLLRDGTIISFTQDPGYHTRFSNIFNRINNEISLLRESEDASFILQALLDTVGDHQLEIIDAFRQEITNLEASVLAKPDMTDVRHLHVLSAQLLLLKSNITPFSQLLNNLRTQDDAKAAASIRPNLDRNVSDGSTHVGVGGVVRTSGFVSHEAKIYFSDVLDHTESVLSSLDLFSSLTENLIAFTFNNLSYSSNSYMQALSVLSVIFLPLTFLSGFYGMNFQNFPALSNDTTYFWTIAIPTATLTTIVFSYPYFIELFKALNRMGLVIYHDYLVRKQEKDRGGRKMQ